MGTLTDDVDVDYWFCSNILRTIIFAWSSHKEHQYYISDEILIKPILSTVG